VDQVRQHEWMRHIVKLATDPDTSQLAALADHLAVCETAKQILRAKGYGATGQAIDATVRRLEARPHERRTRSNDDASSQGRHQLPVTRHANADRRRVFAAVIDVAAHAPPPQSIAV